MALLVLHYPVVVMRIGRDRLTELIKALEDRKQLELPFDENAERQSE
jgi:hypothetical protein